MLENIDLGLFVELGLERDLARAVRVLDAALVYHLTVVAIEIVGAVRIVRPLIPLLKWVLARRGLIERTVSDFYFFLEFLGKAHL